MFEDKLFYDFLTDMNFTGALDYMHKCVPDYLCKWYSLDSSNQEHNNLRFTSLSKNQNWFDTRFNQNDPFDMALYEIDYDELKKNGLEDTYLFEHVINLLRNSLLLCSFCDSEINNLPMWANYANGHQGYCIRYKVTDKKRFFKILYEPKIIKVNRLIAEIIHDANVVLEQKKLTENTYNLRDMFFLINNCKHKSWEYENEYRCLYPIIEGELKGQNVSNSDIGIQPVEIYIGMNCSDENKERLKRIAHDVFHCDVYVCKISKTDFLVFDEC